MDFYVYLHRKKTTGEVFYVGKGKGRRAWQHSDRSDYWKKVANKHGYLVELFQNNIQEWYAFELEKELIAYYGRENLNEGTLVNFTDGGEGVSGYICSPERKQEMSKQRKGELHPNYKPELLYFYNIDTGAIVSDTRVGFKESFPEVSVRALISKSQRSSKRWTILDISTEEDIKALTTGIFKGENNGNFDHRTHELVNIWTGETFNGTRVEFTAKFNLKLDILFDESHSTTTVSGWCLVENVAQVKKMFVHTVHLFESTDGKIFKGTHKEFIKEYGYSLENLFRKKRPAKVSRGWRLLKHK